VANDTDRVRSNCMIIYAGLAKILRAGGSDTLL
jgi:hypothetical protein